MKYKSKILNIARNDLKEIRDYLSEFGSTPKSKLKESFYQYMKNISDNPYIYPEYEENKKYRKAVIQYEYLVFFTVDENNKTVKTERVLSSKRNVKNILD